MTRDGYSITTDPWFTDWHDRLKKLNAEPLNWDDLAAGDLDAAEKDLKTLLEHVSAAKKKKSAT